MQDLSIKQGDTVTILKGVRIRHRGELLEAKKTYKVKVSHTICGVTALPGYEQQLNPTVCWPGPGGYWSEVDINDIPEARIRIEA